MSDIQQTESKQNDTNNANKALLIKLKNILQNVHSQETLLQNKTSNIEKWYKMHQSALQNASNVKRKLIEFEPINEEKDNDETKQKKTDNKNAINLALDNLASELKLLNESEKKYRSTECIQELNQNQAIINELTNKNNILLQHNKALLEQNTKYEEQIKTMTEQHDTLMETTKKEIFDRHKDYVSNLQCQHEGQLKSIQLQHENALNYELAKLRKEKAAESQQQLNELRLSKDKEFELERQGFMDKINALKQDYDKLEGEMDEKDELLTNYVELDKEHQQKAHEWIAERKKLNEQINELKESEMKTTETLLELKNENNRLQTNAVKHSLSAIKQSEKMDKLNLEILELKSLKQSYNTKMEEFNKKYETLMNQYKHIKQEKSVLVKEVKKLRADIIEKDNKKTEILTKMSHNELQYKQQINEKEAQIEILTKQHSDVINRFKTLIASLTDCNSNIDSFSDTINNFSYSGLIESYDTEYEARYKSTQLLNDTLGTNINKEIIKLHKEINFNKIRDEIQEIQTDEVKLKSLFEESHIQISYIRLAALKLLMEYIESIKRCNDMYLRYNRPTPSTNDDNDHDGMYNYVTTGVITVASMVNPFSWKKGKNGMNHELDGDEVGIFDHALDEQKNGGYIGEKEQILNGHFKEMIKEQQDADNEQSDTPYDDEEDDDDAVEDDVMMNGHSGDPISTHYLSKSAFLSVDETLKQHFTDTMEQEAIEINGSYQDGKVNMVDSKVMSDNDGNDGVNEESEN